MTFQIADIILRKFYLILKLTRLNIACTALISSIATLSIKGPKIGMATPFLLGGKLPVKR